MSVVRVPRTVFDDVCPHCNQQIGEKSVGCSFNDAGEADLSATIHSPCGGRIYWPFNKGTQVQYNTGTDAEQWDDSGWIIVQDDGGDEVNISHDTQGVKSVLRNLLKHSLRGMFGESCLPAPEVLLEGLPKSVKERLHRTTRIDKVTPDVGNVEPVIKKEADNDPRQTSRGRASLRGSRKKNQNKKIKKKFKKRFSEAADIIIATSGKPITVFMEHASKVKDKLAIRQLLEALVKTKSNIPSEWLEGATTAISTMIEDTGTESRPFIVKTGDEDLVKELCKEEYTRISGYLPAVWVEVLPSDIGISICRVVGESKYGDRYKTALSEGHVRHLIG